MVQPVPLGLVLRDRHCVVAGEGADARAMVERLRAAGADVIESGGGVLTDSVALVFALHEDPDRNRALAREAHARRIPVHVRDMPELSDIHLPRVWTLADADVAVFHPDPDIVDDLGVRLRTALPSGYARIVDWVRRGRERLACRFPGGEPRTGFWRNLLSGAAAERVLAGQEKQAEALLEQSLASGSPSRGEVYLIGAGPGDPDLLTLRAVRLLQQCDAVLYDRLVAPAVLELLPASVERIYVGKQRDRHPVPQAEINNRLRDLALSGRRVARLKGGDPFIFGRGGEEIEELMQAGVHFQVVPGITAASGCAAYAGIPLTHRDYAQSCVFVTGHRREGGLDVDFRALVRPGQTVVCYMGLHTLDAFCRGLVDEGMDPDTPAALVEQGTTDRQRVIIASVGDLSARTAEADVRAPTLAIIGDVVRLRERLAWFRGSGRGDGF